MSNCSIIRNNQGRITNVLTPAGEKSQLFEAINSNPFIGVQEVALQVFASSQTKDVKSIFSKGELSSEFVYATKEPKLYYVDVNNTPTESLEEVLLRGVGEIGMGYKNPNGSFVRVATFDTNASEKSQFIASQIQQGSISANQVLGEDGINRLQGKGQYPEVRQASARAFQTDAVLEMGLGNVKVRKDGTLDIRFHSDIVPVIDAEGKVTAVHLQDAKDVEASNFTEIMLQHVAKFANNGRPSKTTGTVQDTSKSLRSLETSLMNFLRTIGFTPTTLEDYRARFNTMFGQDPDIEALTDIANKTVAFAQGKMDVENVSEEVAHIAVAAYADQNSINSALVNVIFTPEYVQYAELYRSKYSKTYEGVALEDQVRREILGKILAKKIADNFQTEGLNEEHAGVINFLKNLWDTITRYFSSRVLPRHERVLESITNDIANSILANDVSVFEENLLEGNQDYYYSLSSAKAKSTDFQLRLARKALEDGFRKMGERVPRTGELEAIYEGMNEIDTVRSISLVTDIIHGQVNVLESALKDIEKNGGVLSAEDFNRFQTLNQNMVPIMESLKLSVSEALKNKDFKNKNYEKIAAGALKSMDDISRRMTYIRPAVNLNNDTYVEQMVDSFYDGRTMKEEDRQAEKAKIRGGLKDIGLFGYYFGLMTSSSNPILQMMAKLVANMRSNVNLQFKNRINPIIKEVYDKGLQKYQQTIIAKDDKGRRTFHFFSPIDWDALEKSERQSQVMEVSRLTGKSKEEVEKLLVHNSFRDIISDADKFQEFTSFSKKLREENDNKPMLPEYYEQAQRRFDTVNTSQETIDTLRNLNSRSFAILSKYRDSKGQIDKSLLSEADRIALQDIKKDRATIQSPFDNFGEIREGLKIVPANNLKAEDKKLLKDLFNIDANAFENYSGDIVLPAVELGDLDIDARTALDMSNLNLLFRQEKKKGRGKPNEDFKNNIRSAAARGENPFDWVEANSTITLSDEYYESFGERENANQQIQAYIDSLPDGPTKDDISTVFSQYISTSRRRNLILKQNKQMSSPLEVDVQNMSLNMREAVRELDAEIREHKRELNQILPEEMEFGATGENPSVRELNEDFYRMLADSSLDMTDFCKEHMTPADRAKVVSFQSQLTGVIKGSRTRMKQSFEIFFNDMVEQGLVYAELDPATGEILNKDEIIRNTVMHYASSNVASYFYRYAPEGYSTYMENLRAGTISLEDAIDKPESFVSENPIAKFISINPDYSWTEDISGENLTNPEYKEGGYYRKPKAKWLNKKWFEHYGIKEEDYLSLGTDDISSLIPTKNKEEFEFLSTMIKMREEELLNYKEDSRVNKWQLPQVSKSIFEKAFSAENLSSGTALKATAKDMVRDIIQNRPDELDYGTQMEGADLIQAGSDMNVKILPKYYLEKLESPEAVTENVFASTIMGYRQSLLYKEKEFAERDLQALQRKLENMKFKEAGGSITSKILKSGAVTNTAKKGAEYLGHQLYGIRQTRAFKTQILGREVDLTRAVSSIQGFARFSNLGYNLFVDATGATTGVINKALDTFVGDYYSKSSSKRGNSLYWKYAPEFVTEVGAVKKNSRMQALMEEFDVVSPEDKVAETKYGKGMRVLQKSPYIMSKASNMVNTPRILFSVLSDYRFYNGQFRSYEEFKILNSDKAPGIVKAMWSEIEKDALIDNLQLEAGGTQLNEKFYSKFENKEIAEAHYRELKGDLTAKVKFINQRVDGVISEVDQVAAQRDVLTNTVMMHRGWFLINAAKAFKKRSYNIATGQMEEGHYRTLVNFIKEAFTRTEDKQSFSQRWSIQNLEEDQKRNLLRAGLELVTLGAILALGELVLAADDDDDTWIEDFSRLIYLRTASEIASAQPFAMPGAITEMVKSPFTAIKTYEALDPTFHLREGLWESDEKYYNKSIKKLWKGSFLRRFEQYGDIQQQIDAFRHFNDPTLFNLGRASKDKTPSMFEVKIRG